MHQKWLIGKNMNAVVGKSPSKETSTYTVVDNLLNNEFSGLNKAGIIREFMCVLSKNQPCSFTVSRYNLLINPKTRFVITDSLARFVDYLSIMSDSQKLSEMFTIRYLDKTSFDRQSQVMMVAGAKPMVLDVGLWCFFSALIKTPVKYNQHQLSVQLRYMPNLSHVEESKRSKDILSSCLYASRTIEELQADFPNVDSAEINRVFLLAILSDIAHLPQPKPVQKTNKSELFTEKNNRDIKRARRTGFFNRLLNALAG